MDNLPPAFFGAATIVVILAVSIIAENGFNWPSVIFSVAVAVIGVGRYLG